MDTNEREWETIIRVNSRPFTVDASLVVSAPAM
jgi:hypothetical protein